MQKLSTWKKLQFSLLQKLQEHFFKNTIATNNNNKNNNADSTTESTKTVNSNDTPS